MGNGRTGLDRQGTAHCQLHGQQRIRIPVAHPVASSVKCSDLILACSCRSSEFPRCRRTVLWHPTSRRSLGSRGEWSSNGGVLLHCSDILLLIALLQLLLLQRSWWWTWSRWADRRRGPWVSAIRGRGLFWRWRIVEVLGWESRRWLGWWWKCCRFESAVVLNIHHAELHLLVTCAGARETILACENIFDCCQSNEIHTGHWRRSKLVLLRHCGQTVQRRLQPKKRRIRWRLDEIGGDCGVSNPKTKIVG